MKNLKNKTNGSPGFTLVELLTVIAVVGVLAAILIPVVGNMRTSALRSESVSNLRQLHAACTVYSNDNKSRLANSFIAANEDTGREQSGWWHQLVNGGYLGPGEEGRMHPRFYEVLGSPIQRREVPEITIDRDPPVYCTYGMNGPLTMLRAEETDSVRMNQVVNPSNTLFISEGHLSEGSNWFGVGVSPWGSLPNNTDGTVSFVYLDGHIGQLPEAEFPSSTGERGSDEWLFWYGR